MPVTKIIHLKEDEAVVEIVRHHPPVYIPKIAAALVLFAAPFFFMLPLFGFRPFGVPVGLAVFFLLIFAGCYYAIRTFIIWYWNVFIITNFRVVDVDQVGFFNRTVTEAAYDKVQDVSYQVKGFWATLFGYGTVVVQTAGAVVNLELPYAHDPKEVHHLITETMGEFRRHGEGSSNPGRAQGLLNAAAEMSGPEARAFVVELQEAVGKRTEENERVRSEALEEFMTVDEEVLDEKK